MTQPDVIIVGSGMGGAMLAAALAPSGRRILVLERGERLRPSSEDRNAQAIFGRGLHRSREERLDGQGRPFNPGNHCCAGGNSKFHGAVLIRFRAEDFSPTRHMGGRTVGWPIGYEDLEFFHQEAEGLYHARGKTGEDPTEPPRSGGYPLPPVPNEATIAELRCRPEAAGTHPASLPLGVDLKHWLDHGRTPWDGFPSICGGKMDAETAGLATALSHDNVSLRTCCTATRLIVGEDGRISGIEVTGNGRRRFRPAPVVVLTAGAVQTAALLLASADSFHSGGIANSSDQVGRNFMNRNASAVLALHPFRRNSSVYQKTLMANDHYFAEGPANHSETSNSSARFQVPSWRRTRRFQERLRSGSPTVPWIYMPCPRICRFPRAGSRSGRDELS